jgi:uncharacterized protein involved in exopolysaccharide biosynthesis
MLRFNDNVVRTLDDRDDRLVSRPRDEDLRLRDAIALLVPYRWLIGATALVMAAAMALTAHFLVTKWYEATILLAPVSEQEVGSRLGSVSGLASQLGGLASLAGLSGSGNSFKNEAVATLQSEALTERYIIDNNLLPVLYSDLWDSQRKTWTVTDPKKIPTPWKANRYFQKQIRVVVENNKTGLVSLSIKWTDPALAAQWANGLVKMTNDYLRQKAIVEADRNIDYLNDEVKKTTVVPVQQAVYSLMETEIKKEMLARGSSNYALKVLDPAITPEIRSSPTTLLWLVGGFVLGLFVSVTAAFAHVWMRSR